MKRLIIVLALISSTLSGAVVAVTPAAADVNRLFLKSAVADNSKNATYLGKPGWTDLVDGATTGRFEYTDQKVSGDYSWSVPDKITADGADLTLTATSHDQSGYRFYAYIGVTYGANANDQGGTKYEVMSAADHNAGKDTDTATKTVTIFPVELDGSCSCVRLKLRLGPEGPLMTYTYEAPYETQVGFRFATAVLPNAALSGGEAGLTKIDARGHGSGHILTDSHEWDGIVHIEATRGMGRDERTTLKYRSQPAFYYPHGDDGEQSVVMFLNVKTSTLKGCADGSRARLELNDRRKGKADKATVEYCGRSLVWQHKQTDRFFVHVSIS
jgi:hypothetical protein